VFGTGQYLQYDDIKDGSLQSIYAVHDRGTYNLTRYQQFGGKPALEPRIFTESVATNGGESLRNRHMDGDVIDWGNQFGWYVELASDLDNDNVIDSNEILGERQVFRPFIANQLFIFNTIIPQIGSCSGATNGWTMLIDWTTGLAPPFPTYDANLNGNLDSPDIGAVGYFNEAAGSELGRGGDNIYDSTGDDARRKGVDFGSLQEGSRLGWEEKRPYGVISNK